ncbi:hypothetical protein [Streptomyces jumonjinensis]|uniref:hypothetical protein n=1 Tax=Streptomyces jumonjinensis TaxID=1945 RepID=UPI0037BBD7AC
MIGEIVGGLVLGPTVLGWFAPDAQQWLFPPSGATAHVLGAFHTIGLLLLVYLTGAELRVRGGAVPGRTIIFVAVSGLVLPFAAGRPSSGPPRPPAPWPPSSGFSPGRTSSTRASICGSAPASRETSCPRRSASNSTAIRSSSGSTRKTPCGARWTGSGCTIYGFRRASASRSLSAR